MAPLCAFAGYGIELEYAIVEQQTLDVRPVADRLLAAMAGQPASSAQFGPLGWSNELVRHVVELKNTEPWPRLVSLTGGFQAEIGRANALLRADGAQLMPSGMHPWMDPRTQTELWTFDAADIYAAFDRIFDCRRHGWANLQSMHINLPFAGDRELARLHAAVRAILPLVPALAASSPIADGSRQPWLDYRLEVYRTNSRRVPSIVGDVVPPAIEGRADYERRVLEPMYRDIAPHDPQGTLQREWLNAHGAIVRFDRSAIEIRLCDTQECPRADLAIAAAIIAAVQALYEERWCSEAALRALPTPLLVEVLQACSRDGERAVLRAPAYLAAFGLSPQACDAARIWDRLLAHCSGALDAINPEAHEPIRLIAGRGPLARRLLRAVGRDPDRDTLRNVYRRLCACLAEGALFVA